MSWIRVSDNAATWASLVMAVLSVVLAVVVIHRQAAAFGRRLAAEGVADLKDTMGWVHAERDVWGGLDRRDRGDEMWPRAAADQQWLVAQFRLCKLRPPLASSWWEAVR